MDSSEIPASSDKGCLNIHPVEQEFIRFKLLTTQSELTAAIAQCNQAGWQVINATKLVEKFNSITHKPYARR